MMLNRIRLGLVNPAALIEYRRDHVMKAIGYIFFFAVLMGTALFLQVLSFQGMDSSTRQAMRENFVPLETECAIENATVTCDETLRHTFVDFNNARYTVDSHSTLQTSEYQGFTYHFVMHDDMLYMIVLGNIVSEKPIAELHEDVHNLNLNYTEGDENAFFNPFFLALDEELVNTRAFWGSSLIISQIVMNFILFNLFVLLNAFLTRSRMKEVSFKQMYVLMAYAATLLYIILIFHEMITIAYDVSFLILLIILFAAFRQMNRMAMALHRNIHQQ